MREDPNHFRRCAGCKRRYNAFQYGNYFFCSPGCSMVEWNKRNPPKDEDDY